MDGDPTVTPSAGDYYGIDTGNNELINLNAANATIGNTSTQTVDGITNNHASAMAVDTTNMDTYATMDYRTLMHNYIHMVDTTLMNNDNNMNMINNYDYDYMNMINTADINNYDYDYMNMNNTIPVNYYDYNYIDMNNTIPVNNYDYNYIDMNNTIPVNDYDYNYIDMIDTTTTAPVNSYANIDMNDYDYLNIDTTAPTNMDDTIIFDNYNSDSLSEAWFSNLY